jgi:hypothetical protein
VEYRHLIIDKLKEVKNNSRKIAWLKSFALKTFIIPKNKDKTVPEAKRTGKIEYQRDPTHTLSYFLLHALLTGIKSSFSLGFLLPG